MSTRRDQESRRIIPVLLLVGLLILLGLLFDRTPSLHGAASGPSDTTPTAVDDNTSADDDTSLDDNTRVDDDTREEGTWT